MFRNILFLLLLSCGASGGGSGFGGGIESYTAADDGLDFRAIDNQNSELDYDIVNDNRSLGERKRNRAPGTRIASGTTKRIRINGSSKNFEIDEIESYVGNTITIVDKDSNEIEYTDVKKRLSDILVVKGTLDGEYHEEKIELRLSKSSKICYGIYLAGDNDLCGGRGEYSSTYDFVLRDLRELLNVDFDSDNITVLVFIDIQASAQGYYYNNTPFKEPGIYEISKDRVTKLRNYHEPNTGKKSTLKNFLDAMSDYVDVEDEGKYILDMWSHGFSILGVGYDTSHKDEHYRDDSISPKEFREAIEESKIGKIDVLSFSACLMMDLGLLYELKDVVTAVSGSADYVPGDGTFYGSKYRRGIIGELNARPTLSSQDISELISQENYNSYKNGGAQYTPHAHEYLTYSALDLEKIDVIKTAFIELLMDGNNLRLDLANILIGKIEKDSVFYGRRNNSGTTGTGDLIDVKSLAYAISQHHTNSEFKQKANDFNNTIQDSGFILYNKHIRSEDEFRHSGGFSMLYRKPGGYFNSFIRTRMNEVALYKEVGWTDLF